MAFTGNDIRIKRKSLRMSAQQLADLLDVKKDNIYKWETGTVPSDPEEYLKVVQWLTGKIENVPHETTKQATPQSDKEAMSLRVIQELAEGSARLAEAVLLKEKNTAEMLAMIKPTAYGDQQTAKEVVATVLALRKYATELGAEVRKDAPITQLQELNKIMMEVKPLESMGTLVADGKQGKS